MNFWQSSQCRQFTRIYPENKCSPAEPRDATHNLSQRSTTSVECAIAERPYVLPAKTLPSNLDVEPRVKFQIICGKCDNGWWMVINLFRSGRDRVSSTYSKAFSSIKFCGRWAFFTSSGLKSLQVCLLLSWINEQKSESRDSANCYIFIRNNLWSSVPRILWGNFISSWERRLSICESRLRGNLEWKQKIQMVMQPLYRYVDNIYLKRIEKC